MADVSIDFSSRTVVNWGQRFGTTLLEENHDCRDRNQDRLASIVGLTKGNINSTARFTAITTKCIALDADGSHDGSAHDPSADYRIDVARNWQTPIYDSSSVLSVNQTQTNYPTGMSLQTNSTGRSLTGLFLRTRSMDATLDARQSHYWAPLNSSAFYQGNALDSDVDLLCPAGEVMTRVRYFYKQPQDNVIVIKGIQIRCNPLLEV
jgi:hypothetical protein